MEWRFLKVKPLAVGMSALMVMSGLSFTALAADIQIIEDTPQDQDVVTIDLDSSEYNVNVDWTDESVSLGEIRLSEAPDTITNTVDLGEVVEPNVTAQSNSGGSGSTASNTVDLSSNAITVTLLNSPANNTYNYTGNLISASPLTVRDTTHNNYELRAGTHYTQSGDEQQTNAGDYRITITGTGVADSNGYTYTGSKTINWKIASSGSGTTNSGASNSGTSNSSTTSGSTTSGSSSAASPVINGLTNSASYCESVTFTVTDTDLESVTNNGAAMTASANGSYTITGDDSNHQIIARDRAGNTASVTVMVYRSHTYGAYAQDNNASLTKDATESAKCSHGCGVDSVRTIQNSKVSTGYSLSTKSIGRETSGSGSYVTEVNVATNGLSVDVEASSMAASLARTLSDTAEQNAVSGGQTMTLSLDVQQLTQITRSVNDAITNANSNQNLTVGAYFDLSLFKQLGNNAQKSISDIGSNQIQVTLGLPTTMQGRSGYKVIRVHNGTATILDPTSTTSTSVTFRADKFSTYALAYSGSSSSTGSSTSSTVSGNSVSGNSSTSDSNVVNGSVDNSSGDTAPARRSSTGDDFWQSMGMHLTILLVAAIGLIYCGTVIYRSRKQK